MPIRSKLLILTFSAIVFMAMCGVITASWITLSQYKLIVRDRLDANLRQLEIELNMSVVEFEKTLHSIGQDREVVANTQLLFDYSDNDFKRQIQNKLIKYLQIMIVNRGYDFAAIYGPELIYAYTDRQRVCVVSNAGNELAHFMPESPSALTMFSEELWMSVPAPIA